VTGFRLEGGRQEPSSLIGMRRCYRDRRPSRADPQAFFGSWLARHGLAFADAVLIDDRADNCATFTSCGGAAIQWKMGAHDISDATAQLKEWLHKRRARPRAPARGCGSGAGTSPRA
jgi:hypothetical protein